jgi:hypothetical protein
LLAGCAYLHISLPCADVLTLDESTQVGQQNTDFGPDMLTAEEISTG